MKLQFKLVLEIWEVSILVKSVCFLVKKKNLKPVFSNVKYLLN